MKTSMRTRSSPFHALVLAVAFVFSAISLPGCVDPITSGILVGGGTAGIDKLVEGLDTAIGRLNDEIDHHRAQIKMDALDVLAQAVDDAKELSTHVGAMAGLLEGKVAADVRGILEQTTATLDKLTRDVRAGASEAILQTSIELSHAIKSADQLMGSAKDSVRVLMAKARHDAQGAFVVVVDEISILTLRGFFGLLLLGGVITLIVAVARKSEKKRAGIIVGSVLAASGVVLIVVAPRLAALAGARRAVPDVAAACKDARRLGAEMERRASGVASVRVSLQRGATLNTKLQLDEAALLGALRGGARLQLDTYAKHLTSAPPKLWPKLPEIQTPLKRGQFSNGLALAPNSRPFNWPKVRPQIKPPGSGVTSVPAASEASITELATEILEPASLCSVLGDDPVIANASEKYLARALAYLGIEVVCRSTSQCPKNQWCDDGTRSCLDLGVYCELPDHCESGKECDRSLRRCMDRRNFQCSPSAVCRIGEVCTAQRVCENHEKIVGKPCEDTRLNGPCRRGEWRDDGHRGVMCVSTVSAVKEECDGVDNDCNGTIDDLVPGDLLPSCPADALGICQRGHEVCDGGGKFCEPGPAESPELCNGKDDNCNGLVDDSESCNPVEQVGGTIECGWFGRNDIPIGSDCTEDYERFDWSVDGPQDDNRHAEVVGWTNNKPDSCEVNVHCGTRGANSGKWTIHVRAVKKDR